MPAGIFGLTTPLAVAIAKGGNQVNRYYFKTLLQNQLDRQGAVQAAGEQGNRFFLHFPSCFIVGAGFSLRRRRKLKLAATAEAPIPFRVI